MMRAVLAVCAFVAVVHALPSPECICTMDYTPVCGNDGVTYSNKCAMDCAGIELYHSGECQKLCGCPRIYMPVCGQDGQTYSNQCEMNCAGVSFFQDGACTAVPSSPIQKRQVACICPFNYLPVCGSDGVTYGNQCALDCVTGVTKTKEGEC